MLDRARVRELYLEAADLPGDQRTAFLDRACAGDAELRAEVESLLAAAARRPAFLGSPTTAPPEAPGETPGMRIGPYHLLQEIGRGGFGTVYMAEQDQPVRRRVALKIIKLGMDTRAVIARFEAERQALALMDHAHIARVLDAGATDSGRPFFVMELVNGDPITLYCDRNHLNIPQRLALFQQVCHAVQHAHGKGVIHRDIKPGNVLVASEDGRPHAKVIDFGIAKATDRRLTEKTLFTELRQFVGTPEYMSPEQAEGSVNIDTRSDVYGLGVLLYELLTGSTPFDPKTLRSAAYAEIQRIIREVDPPKPSTRLSQSGSLPEVASHRRSEPARLSAMVRGDLDWIVMRALDKDRARRYDTASALAADISRHLAGQPVEAAPPSLPYRARKFVRRNRALVASGAAIVGALVLGVVGTSVGLVRADAATAEETKQRTVAQQSATRAEAEARRATLAETEALARADELERVAAFQASQLAGIDAALMGWRLREDLVEEARAAAARSGPPDQERPSPEDLGKLLAELNLTNVALRSLDRNIFQRAVAAIETQFKDQPLVAARLMQTCGDTLGTLGLYEEAIRVHRRALELLRREAGDQDARALKSIDSLGYLLTQAGQLVEAEVFVRAALDGRRKLGEDSPDTLASQANLGSLLEAQGKFAESEDAYRDALARLRRLSRADDGDTQYRVLADLAMTVKQRGRPDEAEGLMREALELSRRLHGDDDARTLAAKSNLAAALQARKKLAEATDLAREVFDTSRRVLGDEHPSLLEQVNNLGVMYSQQNKLDEAMAYQRDALARLHRQLGESHPSTLTALNNLAVVLVQRREFTAAAEMFGEGVETSRRGAASTLPIRAMLLHHQADALRRAGKLDEAKRAAREAVDMYRAHPDWNPAESQHADQVLEEVLLQRADHAEVEDLLRASVERERRAQPLNERRLAGRLATLGDNLLHQRKYAEAEASLRQCADVDVRVFPEGDPGRWRLHQARSMLGEALVGQAADPSLDAAARPARLREAEKLLVDAYNEMKDDPRIPAPTPSNPHDRRREALQRIVGLYETWAALEPGAGYDAKATKWRDRAATPDGPP